MFARILPLTKNTIVTMVTKVALRFHTAFHQHIETQVGLTSNAYYCCPILTKTEMYQQILDEHTYIKFVFGHSQIVSCIHTKTDLVILIGAPCGSEHT